MKLISLLLFAAISTTMFGCATDDPSDTGDEDTSMSEQALSSSEQTAFNFFVAKGLTKAQAAGIVGNLIQESNVIATAKQYGGGPGRGIAQWSVGGRWDHGTDSVAHYASVHGLSEWALNTQLQFIWFELTTYGYGYSSDDQQDNGYWRKSGGGSSDNGYWRSGGGHDSYGGSGSSDY